MATYFYNRNDLTARLNGTVCWIYEEATKITNNLKYTGRIDDCRLADLSFVVAAVEALECYTPITVITDETNCLTEVQAENLFNLIGCITGLCFQPKNFSYVEEYEDDDNQSNPTLDSDGVAVVDTSGNAVFSIPGTGWGDRVY